MGVVIDAASGHFIPGALITLAGSDLPPVATDSARGQFSTYDLPPGVEKLDGHAAAMATTRARPTRWSQLGRSVEVQIKLVRSVNPGTLIVKLSSHGKPVTASEFQVTGVATATIQAKGEGNAELLPGHYTLTVVADGFRAGRPQEVDVK